MYDNVLMCERRDGFDISPLATELVSRVPPAPDVDPKGVVEVQKYVSALQGTDHNLQEGYHSYVDKQCGMHVHVGPDPKSKLVSFHLPVLQHIAYIIVQYEGLISRLLPQQRRGQQDTSTEIMAESKTETG
jgi:hypothetical protein